MKGFTNQKFVVGLAESRKEVKNKSYKLQIFFIIGTMNVNAGRSHRQQMYSKKNPSN